MNIVKKYIFCHCEKKQQSCFFVAISINKHRHCEGQTKFDPSIRYRSSLQNYVIDTGKEIILVDTGFPVDFPEEVPNENSRIYTGKNMKGYLPALADLGYKPEQISKILITHKHSDHTGELKSFPNAKIYVNEEECNAKEFKDIENIIPVKFTDGAYYNFPESQKIVDNVYFIKAKGHTKGNNLVVAEDDGLFLYVSRRYYLYNCPLCKQSKNKFNPAQNIVI